MEPYTFRDEQYERLQQIINAHWQRALEPANYPSGSTQSAFVVLEAIRQQSALMGGVID